MLEFKTCATMMALAKAAVEALRRVETTNDSDTMSASVREALWTGERYADCSEAALVELLGRLECETLTTLGDEVEIPLSEEDRRILQAGVVVLLDQGFSGEGTFSDNVHRLAVGQGRFAPPTYHQIEELYCHLGRLPAIEDDDELETSSLPRASAWRLCSGPAAATAHG